MEPQLKDLVSNRLLNLFNYLMQNFHMNFMSKVSSEILAYSNYDKSGSFELSIDLII